MKRKRLLVISIFLLLASHLSTGQEFLAIAGIKGKVGFIDRSGQWVIEPLFDEVTGFSNGLAAARTGALWGYVNTKGQYVIPAVYDKAGPFENPSFAKVVSGQRTFYVGRNGGIVSESDSGVVIFTEDLAILNIGGRYGYITRDSKWQISPQYEMAWPFKNGIARVKKNGEWIYINTQGEKAEPDQLTRSLSFPGENGTLSRKSDRGKWGFTDNSDRWIIYPQFDYAGFFSEGLAPVMIGKSWGYIDTTGTVRIPTGYEDAGIFLNGLAPVRIKGKYGSIDNNGNLVLKPRFDNPLNFYPVYEYTGAHAGSDFTDIVSISSISIPGYEYHPDKIYIPEDRRLALIIGNGSYSTGSYLANPENDAKTMAEALERLGFVVKVYLNIGQLTMKQAIDDFGRMLKDFNVGLFFYAGHGVQVKGYNYLIPVDAAILSERDVEYNCVEAGRVLGVMEDSGCKTNIVILDACRNNPFERSWTRSASGQGLAFMNAPSGSVVAYATAPGRTASDGTGSNGLYTSSLLKHMMTPGLTILEVFQQVRTEVRQKSGNEQIPWESTSLEGNFYFIKK